MIRYAMSAFVDDRSVKSVATDVVADGSMNEWTAALSAGLPCCQASWWQR